VIEVCYKVRSFDSTLTPLEYQALPKFPITVVLDNLRSAFNVGSIFRTADAARIERVITTGYTAHPPHAKLEKTALGTEKYLATDHYQDPLVAIRAMKDAGCKIVALETADKVSHYSEYIYPQPLCLVVGNEALGVSREVLNEVDDVVQIPLFGYKNSLNVVAAFSVVLFEVLRQWDYKMDPKA